MFADLRERYRRRIPDTRQFLARGVKDPRRAVYELLPLLGSPKARDRMAQAIALFRPKTRPFHPSAQANRLNETLRRDGVAFDLPLVAPDILREIRGYFEQSLCHDPFRSHLGRFRYDQPPSPETNMGYFDPHQIVSAPHVLRLFNDPVVLETAELYLGCKPLIDNIGCWWSFGDRPVAKGTQRYHRDYDSVRGFKLFIYLSDVDEGAGPHVFMRGTHCDARLSTGHAQTDQTIHDLFGITNERIITGTAGTRFLADTYGFHKGELPRQGRRLLLTAQYNVNATPHMPAKPFFSTAETGFDPYINRLVLQNSLFPSP